MIAKEVGLVLGITVVLLLLIGTIYAVRRCLQNHPIDPPAVYTTLDLEQIIKVPETPCQPSHIGDRILKVVPPEMA